MTPEQAINLKDRDFVWWVIYTQNKVERALSGTLTKNHEGIQIRLNETDHYRPNVSIEDLFLTKEEAVKRLAEWHVEQIQKHAEMLKGGHND